MKSPKFLLMEPLKPPDDVRIRNHPHLDNLGKAALYLSRFQITQEFRIVDGCIRRIERAYQILGTPVIHPDLHPHASVHLPNEGGRYPDIGDHSPVLLGGESDDVERDATAHRY